MRERSERALVGSNVTLPAPEGHTAPSSSTQPEQRTAGRWDQLWLMETWKLCQLVRQAQELTNKHEDGFGSQHTANNCGFTTRVLMWWFRLGNSNTISHTPGMHLDVFITMTGQVPLCSSLPFNGSVVPDGRRLSGKVSRETPGEEYS